MACYRFLSKPFRGYNLNRYPFLIKIHNYFLNKVSGEYIDTNGFKMIAGKEGWLHFRYTGEYEPLTTKIVSNIIKEGDVVVDIGANIGYYTLLFSKLVGKSGKVYAFEPESNNFCFLKKNIELNGCCNVIAEQKAVSDINGVVKLFLDETNPGAHTMIDEHKNLHSIDVQCVTLDSYFKDMKQKPTLIKADVQGVEDRVLRGASDFVDGKIVFVLELCMDLKPDDKNIVDILVEKGYNILGINENKKCFQNPSCLSKGETLNVLFTLNNIDEVIDLC